MYMYSSQVVLSPFDFRFDHYAKLHDVQTLAMLACIFQEHCLQFDQKPKKQFNNSHTNSSNSLAAAVSRSLVNSGSPPKKYHSQAPPTPTTSLPPHPSPHGHTSQERSPWSVSSIVPITSPISGSWQEVSESDLVLHTEGEDPLVEEQDIHEMKCRWAQIVIVHNVNFDNLLMIFIMGIYM